jgi:hypothetical protein
VIKRYTETEEKLEKREFLLDKQTKNLVAVEKELAVIQRLNVELKR